MIIAHNKLLEKALSSLLRKINVKTAHEGHLGIVKTKQPLKSKMWYPQIDRDIYFVKL